MVPKHCLPVKVRCPPRTCLCHHAHGRCVSAHLCTQTLSSETFLLDGAVTSETHQCCVHCALPWAGDSGSGQAPGIRICILCPYSSAFHLHMLFLWKVHPHSPPQPGTETPQSQHIPGHFFCSGQRSSVVIRCHP